MEEQNQEVNDLRVFIPDFMTQQNMSNYSLAVYGTLQFISTSTFLSRQCVTINQIAYLLNSEETQTKRYLNYIQTGIDELISENIIEMICDKQKHYILDCGKLWIDTKKERFTVITFGEIQTIFKIQNVNNFMLLRYFVFIISTISGQITVYVDTSSKKRVVGTYTIDKLSELSGISIRSVIEYNKLLENSNLIYIHRQNDFVIDEKDNIKRLPNVYGRCSDKLYIDKFSENQQKYKESYKYKEKSVAKANNNRRLAQMYQQILKGNGEKYSTSEISDIHNYVIAQNKKYECLYNKHNNEEFLDKIRDTDVFEQFGYKTEK